MGEKGILSFENSSTASNFDCSFSSISYSSSISHSSSFSSSIPYSSSILYSSSIPYSSSISYSFSLSSTMNSCLSSNNTAFSSSISLSSFCSSLPCTESFSSFSLHSAPSSLPLSDDSSFCLLSVSLSSSLAHSFSCSSLSSLSLSSTAFCSSSSSFSSFSSLLCLSSASNVSSFETLFDSSFSLHSRSIICNEPSLSTKPCNAYSILSPSHFPGSAASSFSSSFSSHLDLSRNISQRNVFVFHLPSTWNEECMKKHFSVYGKIKSIRAERRADGTSKGYGFVCYEMADSAKKCIEKMCGKVFDGKRLQVSFKSTPEDVLNMDVQKLLNKYKNKENNETDIKCSLFVFHIPFAWTDDDLFEQFKPVGNLDSAKIVRKADKTSCGYGFVTYNNLSSAISAVHTMNKVPVAEGKRLKVKFRSESRVSGAEPGSSIFIFHLPHEWTEKELIANFEQFGPIKGVSVERENDTGKSKGYAFVNFQKQKSACNAIAAMNGTKVGNKFLKVSFKRKGKTVSSGNSKPEKQQCYVPPPPPLLEEGNSHCCASNGMYESIDHHFSSQVSSQYAEYIHQHTIHDNMPIFNSYDYPQFAHTSVQHHYETHNYSRYTQHTAFHQHVSNTSNNNNNNNNAVNDNMLVNNAHLLNIVGPGGDGRFNPMHSVGIPAPAGSINNLYNSSSSAHNIYNNILTNTAIGTPAAAYHNNNVVGGGVIANYPHEPHQHQLPVYTQQHHHQNLLQNPHVHQTNADVSTPSHNNLFLQQNRNIFTQINLCNVNTNTISTNTPHSSLHFFQNPPQTTYMTGY